MAAATLHSYQRRELSATRKNKPLSAGLARSTICSEFLLQDHREK